MILSADHIGNVKKWLNANRTVIIVITKIIIAAGLLIFVISFTNPEEVLSALRQGNLRLIFLSFVFLFINLYLQFWKWKITCDYILAERNNRKIIASLFYGLSGGAFTPARLGEYFGRAIAFRDKSILQVTIATLLDKFFPLLVVAFLGSLSSILFLHFYYNAEIYLTLGLFIVVFTLFYFSGLVLLSPKFWDNVLFSKLRSSARIPPVVKNLKVLKNLSRTYVIRMSIISMLFYFCFLLQFAILVIAFTGNTNVLNYLWAGNLIMFAKTVIPPVSFGELGIREGASVFFLTEMGEVASAAFNASIFLFFINVLIPALFGLILFFRKNHD